MYSHIFSIAGRKERYTTVSSLAFPDPNTKKNLRWSIASKVGSKMLPIHACLVSKKGKGYLICGPSKSGKTTLSSYFVTLGYKVVAKDFVLMWDKKGKTYAGDLNYVSENKDKKETEILQIFLLQINDKRDIFKMNRDELERFYYDSMKPWKKSIANMFVVSSLFEHLVNTNVCLGNRVSIDRSFKSLDYILSSNNNASVGIVGIGVLGQDVANLLLDVSKVVKLNLYSRNFNKIKSVKYDLKSARPELEINTYRNAVDCIKNSGLLVVSFKSSDIDNNLKLQERYGRLRTHAKIIWDYTRLLRKTNFKGTVLMLSNPVDILSCLIYKYSNMKSLGKYDWKGLLSNQVYGVGIGLDCARLKALGNNRLELIGEHGSNQYLSGVDGLKLKLIYDSKILDKVKLYSEEIRKGVDRTRFGPSHEVERVVKSILDNQNEILRLSTMSNSGKFWGRPILIDNGVPLSIHKLDRKLAYKMKLFENQTEELILSTKLLNDL